jgi:uncharacterized protein (UPF0335 family)
MSTESEIETTAESVSTTNLTAIVKAWVVNDNQIRALNKKMRELRQEKKAHTERMIDVMKQYEIDNFDVKDGQIHYRTQNHREPLTQKKLLSILASHPQMNEHQANLLGQFIYDSRKTVQRDVISRKITTKQND